MLSASRSLARGVPSSFLPRAESIFSWSARRSSRMDWMDESSSAICFSCSSLDGRSIYGPGG